MQKYRKAQGECTMIAIYVILSVIFIVLGIDGASMGDGPQQ